MDRTMWFSMLGFMSLQSKTVPDLVRELYELWRKYRGSSSSHATVEGTTELVFNLPSNHMVNDEFHGARMSWEHHVPDEKHETGGESKYILKISHTERVRVLLSYIDHISQTAENLERRRRERKLFSNGKIGGSGS
ncbi:hypothetical protein SUGI_1076000 [Cryptomeria japonica]|nr:hypothetical protein SUGI_1076000 [Cryptomeria japonica]